jgi:hypothetical protein
MSVEHRTGLADAARILREQQAEDLNRAAKAHLDWSDFRVPVDKGNLQKSNRQTETATPDSLRAVVVSGGVTAQDGTEVDYAAAVNNGSHHIKADGTEYSIPANPYWTEGEEQGRERMKAHQVARARREHQLRSQPVHLRTA